VTRAALNANRRTRSTKRRRGASVILYPRCASIRWAKARVSFVNLSGPSNVSTWNAAKNSIQRVRRQRSAYRDLETVRAVIAAARADDVIEPSCDPRVKRDAMGRCFRRLSCRSSWERG
jgi:hypothetical protein